MKTNAIKNLTAMILAIIMVVTIAVPVFATANEFVMNFESEYGEIVKSYYYPTVSDEISATIKSDSVSVYDHIGDNSYGVKAEGLKGEKIWLCQYIEYANGEVVYRYYLDDYNSDFYYTAMTYQFISADDVVIDGADVEVEDEIVEDEVLEDEVEEEIIEEEIIEEEIIEEEIIEEEIIEEVIPAITLDFLPKGLIARSSTSKATATINSSSVRVYKSLDNGAEGIEISVDPGTQISLITKYTFTMRNGSKLVFYRYDYTGSNEALYDAAISEYSGYVFIFEEDITVNETVKKTGKYFARTK